MYVELWESTSKTKYVLELFDEKVSVGGPLLHHRTGSAGPVYDKTTNRPFEAAAESVGEARKRLEEAEKAGIIP
jgi:hypothetical protein